MHQAESIQISQLPSFVPADRQSPEMVDRLLHFASKVCDASGGLFFWIGQQGEIVEPHLLNVSDQQVAWYNEHGCQLDPIHMNRLRAQQRRVAILSQEHGQCPAESWSAYQSYLRSMRAGDDVALVIWRGQEPLACLSFIRAVDQPRFSRDGFDWDSLQSFAESSLSLHWRVRSINVAESLKCHFGLKPRELEVVRYVLLGKSNHQIAEILGISLQTVKSHIVSILDKTGVDSRLGIACLVHGLEVKKSRTVYGDTGVFS